MATQWRNTVQREDPAKPLGFDPPKRDTQVGDAIFFDNIDKATDRTSRSSAMTRRK
jgi:hypothetical protein